MTFNELAKMIKKMTKVQRETEVCVFEEGTRRYIWPAHVTHNGNRPFLEGVASEGDRDIETFDASKVRGTKSRDVDSVRAHPTGLDATANPGPDRVRAAKRTELDAATVKPPKKGDKSPKDRRK